MPLKYEIRFTNQFKSDIKKAKKQKKDIAALMKVVSSLASGETLDEKYKDHALVGNYNGMRECHIQPDWLLIYQKNDSLLVLVLYRVGSHSDLFK